MNKFLLPFVCVTGFSSLCLPAFAETPQETIANLQKENASLRIAVGQATAPIHLATEGEVESEAMRKAAVQRINEANEVARQWRSKAVNLQRELSYTKGLLAASGVKEAGTTQEAILLPKLRGADVMQRPADPQFSDVALHPTIALR